MRKLGLREFKKSTKLEGNAHKTALDGHGSMIHQLLAGTGGQVLAPAQASEFKHAFVGGWLCEAPEALSGECTSASDGWTYNSRGHFDILTNEDYKFIGCSWAEGIWGCDVSGDA
ncbi:hypothetical protein K504DRAFT_386390 [Pleomassaria siparia CBS 279.74]|uniref:SCP domain-containing protein n=1 Tax=Pleomassaria siparia CBS 279.74 TaxID=1314801 RepID=A0A6G1K1E5_9PLEO|nr:hypothetical protein K504DRAFT_386390 [Pleomassaria siparia CBS 279.74]